MQRLLLGFLILSQTGCVSGYMTDREPSRLFREGRYEEAAKKLEKSLEEEGDGKDQLLYLFDIGLAYHTAGLFDESNKALLKAEEIADIKDYTSLAAEASTLLVSDNVKHYQGEDFEKVMVNVLLAMNFAAKGGGDYESALVEARKVNRKLGLMITEGRRKYQLNPFAYYLSAILYEASGDYEDAYIDYKKTYDLMGATWKQLGVDLWRSARISRRTEDLEKWDSVFGLTQEDHDFAKRGKNSRSEIIVLYENGISPIKKPHPNFNSIPKFYARPNPISGSEVLVNGEFRGRTQILYDIETTAIKNLDDNYAGIIAKKIAGVVAKEVIGYQVARQTDNEALGFLTKLVLYASDQADLRSWHLLPRDLQIARVLVDPGKYRVGLRLMSAWGSAQASLPEREIEVAQGKKTFVIFRSMP